MDEDASYPPFTHAIYMFAYNYGELVCAISAIAFTASCVWLMVRIVNRRERWAKRTLAGVIGIPVLYVASFGPACWISSRLQPSGTGVSAIYVPIIWVMIRGRPYVMQLVLVHYATFGGAVPHTADPNTGIEFE